MKRKSAELNRCGVVMKTENPVKTFCSRFAIICVLISIFSAIAGESGAQPPPADLSPALQEVVNLSKAGVGDDVILTYIANAGNPNNLSADDILYLKKQGVSDNIIKALIGTASVSAPQTPVVVATPGTNPVPLAAPTAPAPPPLDESTPAANLTPNVPTVSPYIPNTMSSPPPASAPPGLVDNFFADPFLNTGLWETQSDILRALASSHGTQVLPALTFKPSGMQMTGIIKSGQFMGIQSKASFSPPFSFTTTVTGREQIAIPFEIYLVSSDLRQWVTVTGHLGGRGRPRGDVNIGAGGRFFRGDVNIPFGGSSRDYGFWINHAVSRIPISALGYKFADNPLAGVRYTISILAGADGFATVGLTDAVGVELAPRRQLTLGSGPFYVVLAARDGATSAEWQSVRLIPSASTPVVTPTPTVAPVASLEYFQSQLAPYGSWVNIPGYGVCWQPYQSVGWRPYYDRGRWEYTDAGWYWQSDYPWGDIAFHYGRWAYTTSGWVWIPGYEYAPAWVVWRHADEEGYIGWAPLPPGALFVNGTWEYNHVRVGADFAFGLGDSFFTFVDYGHLFFDPHLHPRGYRDFVVPRDRLAFVYRHSVIESRYRHENGRFVNEGLPRERMAVLTHNDIRDIKEKPMSDLKRQEEEHDTSQRAKDLHDFKPSTKADANGSGKGRASDPNKKNDGGH